MKKQLLLIGIFSWLITSCISDEPLQSEGTQDVCSSVSSTTRTIDEAISIIEENYDNLLDTKMSRAGLKIDRDDVIVIGSESTSRSAVADTALYVVNFGENSGFAVITADKDLTPILAMTDNGEINNVDDIEVPGLKAFMKASIAYASRGGGNSTLGLDPGVIGPGKYMYYHRVVDTSYVNKSPCVEVAWGQDWPTGYFCPNKISGCVVTAAVQALSYFEYPKYLKLTYPERDKETEYFNWPNIKAKVESSPFQPITTTYIDGLDEHLALARLSAELGQRIIANYDDPTKTSASLHSLWRQLKQITPSITFSEVKYEVPKISSLYQWNIILMDGYYDEDYKGGHTWLIDGYKSKVLHVREYEIPAPPLIDLDGNIVVKGYTPVATYNNVVYSLSHINWGWDGFYNGYYDVGVYDLSKCKEPDGQNYKKDINFSYITRYFTMYRQ